VRGARTGARETDDQVRARGDRRSRLQGIIARVPRGFEAARAAGALLDATWRACTRRAPVRAPEWSDCPVPPSA
jgi:hypothetical protein